MMPTKCTHCKHHQVIPDPDPFDSFCSDDQAIVCLLAKNPSQDLSSVHRADHSPHRVVAVAIRPYNLRKEDRVPGWCPLIIDAETA
jgi:hypothetical protein